MTNPNPATATDVIAALRLAQAGAANDRAFRVVAEQILLRAPESPDDAGSVHLLIEAIHASDARLELT